MADELNQSLAHFSDMTLGEAVREHLDYAEMLKRSFAERFEILGTGKLFQKEITRVVQGVENHDLRVYGIDNPMDFDYFWRTAGKGDMVSFGFYKMVEGDDDVRVGFRKDPVVTHKMQEFRAAMAPNFFTKHINITNQESDVEYERLDWLEGIWLLIRGGNLAHYRNWLENQEKYFDQHGKLKVSETERLNDYDEENEVDDEGDEQIRVPKLNAVQHKFVLLNELGIVDLMKQRKELKTQRQLVQLLSLICGLTSKQSHGIKSCLRTFQNRKHSKNPYTPSATSAVRKALLEIGIDIDIDKVK